MFLLTDIITELMRDFSKKSLCKALEGKSDMYSSKVENKIDHIARNSSQYNHKIIKAFLQLEKESTVVSQAALEQRCSDKNLYPETFVEKFKGNYDQMKTDKGHSNGMFFEERNGNVYLHPAAEKCVRSRLHFFI